MLIKAVVEIKPTEDEERVRSALLNIIQPEKISTVENEVKKILIAESNMIESLNKLRNIFKRRRILNAARSLLKQSINNGRIIFYLNKQAAYMGYASFCNFYGESPLGPIMIEITCDDPEEVIDWLTSEN